MYTINLSDPLTPSFSIPDGAYNGPGGNSANTSLRLYGRGALEWGESINEDLAKLLETFSGATAPIHPINGQMWVETVIYYRNTTTNVFYVYHYTDLSWHAIEVIESATAIAPTVGIHWYNTVSNTLYMYGQLYNQYPLAWMARSVVSHNTSPTGSTYPTQVLRVYDAARSSWSTVTLTP